MMCAKSVVRGHQKVVLARCFQDEAEDQSWEISSIGCQPVPVLNCNSEESDTRIWLHVLRSEYKQFAPDTGFSYYRIPSSLS